MGQGLKAGGKVPWVLNLAQAVAGALILILKLLFYADIVLENELRAIPLAYRFRVFLTGGFSSSIAYFMMIVLVASRNI